MSAQSAPCVAATLRIDDDDVMRRDVLTVFALTAQSACSLLVDTSDLRSGSEGGANEGGADASDASSPINLLTNGNFDEGTAACGPGWTSSGTMKRSTIAHSGAYSCEVCPINGGVSLSASPSLSIAGGATFYAQAWVMLEGTSSSSIRLDLEELVSGGGTLAFKPGNASNTGWQLLQQNTSPAKAGGTGITFAIYDIGIDGGLPSCVLIDDAQLIAQ
jgi:hypothetical protein